MQRSLSPFTTPLVSRSLKVCFLRETTAVDWARMTLLRGMAGGTSLNLSRPASTSCRITATDPDGESRTEGTKIAVIR